MLGLLAVLSCARACTIIAAGKHATVDGSTIVAHNDDAGGGASDLRLIRVPAMDHKEGAMRPVFSFRGQFPRVRSSDRSPGYAPEDGSKDDTPLGFIPQVAHTYAYWDLDYGLMNEHSLGMAEATCNSKSVGWASDLPYGYNLFGIAELSKVALERCITARCAVSLMGDLAVKHGFFSEDSGDPAAPCYMDSAEALAITDRDGEVWLFNVATGPNNASAVWAAQRIPDDHVHVTANSFAIREMNLTDKDNFMASANVMSFAKAQGWWDGVEEFDFFKAYGYIPHLQASFYTGRRLWRGYNLLVPSLEIDPHMGLWPDQQHYPFSAKPTQLVTVEDVKTVLRDYLEGTEFDLTQGFAAGPFHNPARFDPGVGLSGIVGAWERPLSIFRCVFTFVLSVNAKLPLPTGGLIWLGLGAPHGTVYNPFFASQDKVPASYAIGLQSRFTRDSAYWAFGFVNNWARLRFDAIQPEIVHKQRLLHAEAKLMLTDIEKHFPAEYGPHDVTRIGEMTVAHAEHVIHQWWQFGDYLISKYADGYIMSGEEPNECLTPGYPEWFKDMTSFSRYPLPGDVCVGAPYTGVRKQKKASGAVVLDPAGDTESEAEKDGTINGTEVGVSLPNNNFLFVAQGSRAAEAGADNLVYVAIVCACVASVLAVVSVVLCVRARAELKALKHGLLRPGSQAYGATDAYAR